VAGPGVRGPVQVQAGRAVHVGRDRPGRRGYDGTDHPAVSGLRVARARAIAQSLETGEQRGGRVPGRQRAVVGAGQRRFGRGRRRDEERGQSQSVRGERAHGRSN